MTNLSSIVDLILTTKLTKNLQQEVDFPGFK